MIIPSKWHWLLVLLSLLALRLVIGWHFYTEGVAKLKSGRFTAEPFLRSAKGPWANLFRGCIGDSDGRLRLGLVQTKSQSGEVEWQLDPLVTEELWKGFAYRAAGQLRFGDPQLIELLTTRCKELNKRLGLSGGPRESLGETSDVREDLRQAKESLEIVRKQKEAALAVAQKYIDEYRQFLADNESEILIYFRAAPRAEGFDRDGDHKNEVVRQVNSLRSQAEQIQGDRLRDARAWLAEVDAMWDGIEADINALAIPEQKSTWVRLVRPHQSYWTPLPWIDRIVPWFDTIVGALLILGLLTPVASLAGAGFLLSIIATQPPWVAGTLPTSVQWIEMVGLLVVFACGAGRIWGLDSILHQGFARFRAARERSP